MTTRLFIWGAIFAAIGGFLAGKNSYDQTGKDILYGAAIGLLLGFLLGAIVHKILKRK